jgi:hypothetical protein
MFLENPLKLAPAKKHTLIFLIALGSVAIAIFLSNWLSVQQNVPCASQPKKFLGNSEVETLDLSSSPKLVSVQLSGDQLRGYTFSSKTGGQRLEIESNTSVCNWLYSQKDSQFIPVDREIEKGKNYILHLQREQGKGISSFLLKISLSDLQKTVKPNTQASSTVQLEGSSQEISHKVQDKKDNSITFLDIDWRKDILLAIFINFVASLLLVLGNNLGVKSWNEHAHDFKEAQNLKDLRYFWFGPKRTKKSITKSDKYTIIHSVEKNGEPSVLLEYSRAKTDIKHFLEKEWGCNVSLKEIDADTRINLDLFKENIVLLTGEKHPIVGFDNFVDEVKLTYYYRLVNGVLKLYHRSMDGPKQEQLDYRQASAMDNDNHRQIQLEFCVLTRFFNPRTKKVIIILNGEHGFGVSSLAYFLTAQADQIHTNTNLRYLDFKCFNKEVNMYQIVLEANNILGGKSGLEKNTINLQLFTWCSLDVKYHKLEEAICRLCQGG